MIFIGLFRLFEPQKYNVICGLRLYVQGDWQIKEAQEPRFRCIWGVLDGKLLGYFRVIHPWLI
ncbi:MAG TPA: hypothetical protein DDZ56_06830 [Cytophagales bacterium]|nr:hypothetical protein [Cytophagales bacterium]